MRERALGGMLQEAKDAAAAAEVAKKELEAKVVQLEVDLKVGNGVFIKLPWASSSRAPVEGEEFDGEVLASAGLSVVDVPSTISGESEEEELLRKLVSLYRARQAKLESREALVAQAGVDIEKHAEEL